MTEQQTASRKTNILLSVAITLIMLFVMSGATQAQSMEKEDGADQSEAASYSYTAEECDTLTHLARRTVQLEDASNDEVDLSGAAVVFAENQLVEAIGGGELTIGQEVTFESEAVKNAVSEASQLDETAIANWQNYADQVNFQATDSIQPSATPPGVTVTESVTDVGDDSEHSEVVGENNDDNNEGEDKSSDQDNEGTDNNEVSASDEEEGSESGGTPWYWWVIGAGAVGGVWYLLWNRAEKRIAKTSLGAEEMVRFRYFETAKEAVASLDEKVVVLGLEQTNDSVPVEKFKAPKNWALIAGNEVEGLEPDTVTSCDKILEITQRGTKESLNVSSAAAIAIYQLTN